MDHPSSHSKRILIIEDHEDSALALGVFLRTLGHAVETAGTATEGFDCARARRPDVILSDIGLPDEDGLTLARRVRANGTLQRVWLIALTAHPMCDETIDAGFDHFMRKPADLEMLAALLRSLPPSRVV